MTSNAKDKRAPSSRKRGFFQFWSRKENTPEEEENVEVVDEEEDTAVIEEDRCDSTRSLSEDEEMEGIIDNFAEMRSTAIQVDAFFQKKREVEADEEIKNRKGDFNPSITPDDPIWIRKYQYFQDQMSPKSLQEIIETEFNDIQFTLIFPTPNNSTILEIQKANTESYKENLAGRFSGVKDNIVTKLTMLWFGLPVEPMTMNNITHAGNGEDDPPDEEPEPPRYQRITYSEKPLEFLDNYYQRSHGYPRLYLPRQRPVKQSMSVLDTTNTRNYANPGRGKEPRGVPIVPVGDQLNLRGGEGPENFTEVWNTTGKEYFAADSEESFWESALALLKLEKISDPEFVIDVYEKGESRRNFFIKRIIVTRANFSEVYNDEESLGKYLGDKGKSARLRISPKRSGRAGAEPKARGIWDLPTKTTKLDTEGGPSSTLAPPNQGPEGSRNNIKRSPTPAPPKVTSYLHDLRGNGRTFKNWQDFRREFRAIIGAKDKEDYRGSLSLYENSPKPSLDGSVRKVLSWTNPCSKQNVGEKAWFEKNIAKLGTINLTQSDGLVLVAHKNDDSPPKFWPPDRDQSEKTTEPDLPGRPRDLPGTVVPGDTTNPTGDPSAKAPAPAPAPGTVPFKHGTTRPAIDTETDIDASEVDNPDEVEIEVGESDIEQRTDTPHVGNDRIASNPAQRPKTPDYQTYREDQDRQDRVHADSFHGLTSIINPRNRPDDPEFGLPVEEPLGMNSDTPTVYVSNLSPTQIRALQEENQKLITENLDRISRCPIPSCGKSFAKYQTKQIEEHYNAHDKAEESAGKCPECDAGWELWSKEEKLVHLKEHCEEHSKEKFKNTIGKLRCPLCNKSFEGRSLEYIISHIAEHPGQKYCNQCGVKTALLGERRRETHYLNCKLGKTSWPTYCPKCRRELDPAMMRVPHIEGHLQNCTGRGKYHPTCGFNFFGKDDEEKKFHELTCRPLSGWKDDYCKFCGKNISARTQQRKRAHISVCLREAGDRWKNDDMEGYFTSKKTPVSLKGQAEANEKESKELERLKQDLEKRSADLDQRRNNLEVHENSRKEEYKRLATELKEAVEENKADIGFCPIYDCGAAIGGFSRRQIQEHIFAHSKRPEPYGIKCPLEIVDPENPGNKIRCGKRLQIQDDYAELIDHYGHLADGHKGPAVGETGEEFLEVNSKMKRYVKRLKEYVENNEKLLRKVEKRGIRPKKRSIVVGGGPGDPGDSDDDDDDSHDDSGNHDGSHRDDGSWHSSIQTASNPSSSDMGDYDDNPDVADAGASQPNQPDNQTEDDAPDNTGFANPPVFFEVDPYRPQKVKRRKSASNLTSRVSGAMRMEPFFRGESGSKGIRRNRLKRGMEEDDQSGIRRGRKRRRGR